MSSKEDLAAYHRTLKTIRDRIASQVREGKSLEEVRAAKPTKDFDEAWGKGFIKGEQLTEFIYRSLKP